MPFNFYSQRPTNVKFHNLTRNKTLPYQVKELLGLGFQFCPNPPKAQHNNNIDETLKRFSRNLKLKLFFPPETKKPTEASPNTKPAALTYNPFGPNINRH